MEAQLERLSELPRLSVLEERLENVEERLENLERRRSADKVDQDRRSVSDCLKSHKH